MTQQAFFQAMDNTGISISKLDIRIGIRSGLYGAHGIYQKDGQWIYYFADDRNYIDEETIGSEEKAFDKMYASVFADLAAEEYIHGPITEDIAKMDKQAVCQYLCKTYSMSEQKASDTWDKLKKNMHVLFEFKHYIATNEFVPDESCYKQRGYSAEQLYKTTSLTPLGAFNYLTYLQNKPQEALAYLKKGLSRRRLFSPQDVENLKKYMD